MMQKTVSNQDSWVYRVLGNHNFEQQRGFFAWWYRLTSPPDAKPDATFQQRDRIRRCRLASALMLFLGTVLLLAGTIGVLSPNHTILFVVSSMFVAIFISIPMNRQGGIEVVGILLLLGLTVGMYTSVLADAYTVGMSPNDKDILYLLFFSELFAGALLPINFVFLIALMNMAFSFFSLRYAPHDPALTAMLTTDFAAIFPRLLQIHIIASGIMWILVNHLYAAIRRADRAVEVAKLQHDIAEMTKKQLLEKQALETSIQGIIEIHRRVASGDLHARVLLAEGQTLYQIAGPLNTLISKYQRASATEQQWLAFQRHMPEAQARLHQAIALAIQDHHPLQLPADPLLTPLFQELNGKYIVAPHYQSSLQH
jgi:hypothetical protein